MAEPIPLNNQTHRDLGLAVERARRDSTAANVVSVVPREFQRLVGHFPIFFAKGPQGSQFEPVVLLGFANGENLLWTDKGWDAPYMPLQVQRQPFVVMPRPDSPAGTPSLDVGLDVTLPCVQADGGERLFSDDGQTTPFLKDIGSVLNALVVGSREAHAFTNRLAELNLLESVQINIEFVNATTTKFDGLYRIAAAPLKALSGEVLAQLRDAEYLEWMYFQMASLAHVPTLVARKNRLLSIPAQPPGV